MSERLFPDPATGSCVDRDGWAFGPEATMDGGGAHVLIVEDDLVSGLGVQHLLELLGFTSFAFAGTGAQAGEQARLRRPDLLTVDLGLLDGDGLEACRQVEAACGAVPTVFVTGSPDEAPPGAAVVEKPVGAGSLERAVVRARAAAG